MSVADDQIHGRNGSEAQTLHLIRLYDQLSATGAALLGCIYAREEIPHRPTLRKSSS